MNFENKPGQALFKSISGSTHAVDLIDKLGEVGIDSLMSPGLLKDIPLIGTVAALHRAGNHMLANLFAKRLLKFLAETDRMSQAGRDAFYREISASEAESLGETTLLLLDRCDSDLQAVMLGRAFVHLLEGTIARNMYELYGFIIRDLNRYYVQQIRQIYGYTGVVVYDEPAVNYLAIHGLVDLVTTAYTSNGSDMQKTMRHTPFGKAFHDHIIADR